MKWEELTQDQRDALGITKTVKRVYEENEIVIDEASGQILTSSKKTIQRTSNEPEYVKLYYKTMLAFNGVSDIPLDFVIAMSNFISWSNNGSELMFKNDKITRESITRICQIKDSMYQKYITRCREKGLLFPLEGYRGCYAVNPFFIAKGGWDSIKKLQANFDFTSGQWQRRVEGTQSDSDNVITRLTSNEQQDQRSIS